MGDIEAWLAYLEGTEGPLSYLLLAASALLEYVFPPFPGDTITLFGTFLAATAGYSAPLVYAALTVGSTTGGMVAWSFGRFLGRRRERWPRFLRGPRTERAIATIEARFERHGSVYLVLNRFLPALRAFFFVAAGMSGMRPLPVLVYGGLSAAIWNGLIFALGWTVGREFERLEQIVQNYSWAALGVVVVGVVVFVVRMRREAPAEDPGDDPAPR